jgi:hypothetical protein
MVTRQPSESFQKLGFDDAKFWKSFWIVRSVEIAKAAGLVLARLKQVDVRLTIGALVMATAALTDGTVVTGDPTISNDWRPSFRAWWCSRSSRSSAPSCCSLAPKFRLPLLGKGSEGFLAIAAL